MGFKDRLRQLLNRVQHQLLQVLNHAELEPRISNILCMGFLGGIAGSLLASLYLALLEFIVELVWEYPFHALKEAGYLGPDSAFKEYNYIWIASLVCVCLLSLTLKLLGSKSPAGIVAAIDKIHSHGRVPPNILFPLLLTSLLSITAGSGVGPEAPLMVCCGSLATFIGEKIGLQTRPLRVFVLSGIAGGLSAFFGSPLTGLFILENLHMLGIEYFEAFVPSVIASLVGGTILQAIFSRPYGAFFSMSSTLEYVGPIHILLAVAFGGIGALIAFVFWALSTFFGTMVKKLKIGKYHYLFPFAAWVVFATGGMLYPATLFWGEPDLQNVIDLNVDSPLPHWKGNSSGIIPLGEEYSVTTVFFIGLIKLLVLPFSIAMSMKGGMVFPLFAIGAAFGQVIHMLTGVDQALTIGCVMASAQAASTRTPFASVFVVILNSKGLTPQLMVPFAVASYLSVFVNYRFKVLVTQRPRNDIIFVNVSQTSARARDGDTSSDAASTMLLSPSGDEGGNVEISMKPRKPEANAHEEDYGH